MSRRVVTKYCSDPTTCLYTVGSFMGVPPSFEYCLLVIMGVKTGAQSVILNFFNKSNDSEGLSGPTLFKTGGCQAVLLGAHDPSYSSSLCFEPVSLKSHIAYVWLLFPSIQKPCSKSEGRRVKNHMTRHINPSSSTQAFEHLALRSRTEIDTELAMKLKFVLVVRLETWVAGTTKGF
ncbi:uncharacterized protein G2W53_010808 [Senna tora]|uniref:Uncharacterized protein n=1 Tax=Senna tora TaxID=362788 RepID=A0A835CA67_9FABA|nr:uncharacterized protein G2W53_010808 [Senna tora]